MLKRALTMAGRFQVLVDMFRGRFARKAGSALPGRLLAAHNTRHRGVAEGSVTGGMPQGFQDTRHPDLVSKLQDLGDVVAGGASMRLDEPVGKGLGDLSQA